MKCQQKSGVFLNISCNNTKAHTCSRCKKDVCKTHSHILNNKKYCEDCYWEVFILTTEMKPDHKIRRHDDDIIISSSPNMTSNTSSSSEPDGFGGGFGGGEFSGGGAGGSWTEGDMQSLTDTDGQGGFLTDGDDTFFYS